VDWQDPVWVRFQRKRQEWLTDFAHLVTSTIKKNKPGATVSHQSGALAWGSWANAASVELAGETDWLSADTYSDREGQSYTNKLFYSLSTHKPWEHVQGWGMPDMTEAVVQRTEADMRVRAFDAFVNDGAMTFLECFAPDGTLNKDHYIQGGKVFAELAKYEPYAGGTFRQDIAIYHSYDSTVPNRFTVQSTSELCSSQDTQDMGLRASEHQNARLAMGRTLLANHLPLAVVTRKDIKRLTDFQIVVLSNLVMMNDEEVEAIRNYVKEGGSLYASKLTSLMKTDGQRQKNFMLSDLFGVSYVGESQELVTYVDPTDKYKDLFVPFKKKWPVTLKDSQVLVRLDGEAEVLATLTLPYTKPEAYPYASILQNPPGIYTDRPSIVLNKYGKGKVMYSAGGMEVWDYETQRAVLVRLMRLLTTRPLAFETKAPQPVEVTLFEQENNKRFVVHILNHQLDLPNIPIDGITMKIWTGKKVPAGLVVLPNGQKVNYIFKDGVVEFTAPRLETYLMLGLTYK
jgi:hypothetical protein